MVASVWSVATPPDRWRTASRRAVLRAARRRSTAAGLADAGGAGVELVDRGLGVVGHLAGGRQQRAPVVAILLDRPGVGEGLRVLLLQAVQLLGGVVALGAQLGGALGEDGLVDARHHLVRRTASVGPHGSSEWLVDPPQPGAQDGDLADILRWVR
ncbi:MAG: hypothetical protein QM733_09015 [Ilumatobacteraceae bacterium]